MNGQGTLEEMRGPDSFRIFAETVRTKMLSCPWRRSSSPQGLARNGQPGRLEGMRNDDRSIICCDS